VGVLVDMHHFILHELLGRLLCECKHRLLIEVAQSGREGREVEVVVSEVNRALFQEFVVVFLTVFTEKGLNCLNIHLYA
jgi:hypothetical protein